MGTSMISELEIENRKKRYWKYLQDSVDTSKSGVIISPDGWFEAVDWLLKYAEELEEALRVSRISLRHMGALVENKS